MSTYRCVGSVKVSYSYTALCSCLDMDVVPVEMTCL